MDGFGGQTPEALCVMRWKRKLALALLGTAVTAIGGTEFAKKRFSEGKGSAYRKFLDKIIYYRDPEREEESEE